MNRRKPAGGLVFSFLWAAVCVVLAAALMLLGGSGVFALVAGPAEIAALPPDEWSGRYVTLPVATVLDEYAYSENQAGEEVGREYAVATPDGLHYFGAAVARDDFATLADPLAALAAGQRAAPVTLTGTLQPMDADTKTMFDDALAFYGVRPDMALYYTLEAGRAGPLAPGLTWLAAIAALALVLSAAALVVLALRRARNG